MPVKVFWFRARVRPEKACPGEGVLSREIGGVGTGLSKKKQGKTAC